MHDNQRQRVDETRALMTKEPGRVRSRWILMVVRDQVDRGRWNESLRWAKDWDLRKRAKRVE
jgi:hypothetical protein